MTFILDNISLSDSQTDDMYRAQGKTMDRR